MRELLNKGKGSHYSAKRRHATTKDIEEFGFVPKPGGGGGGATAAASAGQAAQAAAIAPLTQKKRPPGWGTKTIPSKNAGEEGRPRRWWRIW